MDVTDSLTIRRAVRRYASSHGMSLEVAKGMQVAALIGWLEADEARWHHETCPQIASDAPGATKPDHEASAAITDAESTP